MPLNQNYSPKDNETKIYSQWMDVKVGHVPPSPLIGGIIPVYGTLGTGSTPKSPNVGSLKRKTHAILMPPPNLTGDLHAGHAFQHYLMDTLSRLARQRGEANLWFPGVDHAGLQLEGVIDKLIKKGEFDELIYSPCQGARGYHLQSESGHINLNTSEDQTNCLKPIKKLDLPLNKDLINRAKEMSKNMTESEKVIWIEVLSANKTGYKWVKQQIVGNYILDFFCFELGLCIEIDGESHVENKEYDKERTNFLKTIDIKVIRYLNTEVKTNIDGIYQNLMNYIINGTPQPPDRGSQNIPKDELPKYLKANHPDLWLECAWSKVNQWRDTQKNQAAVLGDTPDYSRSLFTLDDQNIQMVNYAFAKYWCDGLIYKGSYLVNWSVGLQTALSDISGEIEYEKRIDPFVTFEYRLFEKKDSVDVCNSPYQGAGGYSSLNKSILVSTVRPETIFGDYAVAVHPEVFDRDYSEFQELLSQKNLFVQLPLTDRFVPVILANEVDPSFGSGALKITPANDIVDYEIFNKYLGGEFEGAIGRDGKLTELCGKYTGLTVLEARKATIKDLIEQGFVPKKVDLNNENNLKPAQIDSGYTEKKDSKAYFGIEFIDNINPEEYQVNWNYEHNVTVCERTKTVVEPLISEEFFISYHKEFDWTPVGKKDNSKIENYKTKTNLQSLGIQAVNQTNFYSEDYQERGVNFLKNIKDWCISRDLIWGHKMPVWYNLDTNPERKFWSYEEVNPASSQQPLNKGQQTENIHFAISPTRPTTAGNWVQEEKILDTWFSSCLWPLSTLRYIDFVDSKENTDFAKFYPTQEMTTGKDIFYQWIVRMTTLCYYFTADIPYTDLVITPTILDDKGKKMSKSLGNGMDPVGQIDKYSSDAMRMAMLGGMIPDRNIKMGGRLADELCEKYRNFGNKMWNIARFFEYQEDKINSQNNLPT